jgi:excisionase family DNA binding protein
MSATDHDVQHQLLTVSEAALRARVSASTIRRLCALGELPHVRVGSQWRVPASALDPEEDK